LIGKINDKKLEVCYVQNGSMKNIMFLGKLW